MLEILGALCWGCCTLLFVLICLLLVGTWNHREFKNRGLVFAKPLPFVGNYGGFMMGTKSQGQVEMELYNKFNGHRAFGSFNFARPTVFIRDPELIRLIAVKDFDYFTDHTHFYEESDDKLFGKVLFNLRGSRWRRARTTISPAFTASKIKAMFSLVDKCGKQLTDHLMEKCKAADGFYKLEMRDLFTRYATDVIASSAYGIQCDSLKEPDNEFYKMGLDVSDFGGMKALNLIGYMVLPKLMRFLQIRLISLKLENFFCSIINDTMAKREREKIILPDLIHLLMEARKRSLKEDEGDDVSGKELLELTDDDNTSLAFMFLVAGFDTSSTLLSFLSYQLAINPDIQEKVQQEIDEVLADNNGVLSYEAVQKMKYMDTVISETLRMWPPVLELDRVCIQDYIVPATESEAAIVIKKGDGVLFPVYGIHHDPEYWPQPECFDPERFSEEDKQKIKPFTFMPFGVGPRGCIGIRYALIMTKIAMAKILAKMTLEVTEKTPIPIRLQKGTFNVVPEGGMWLGVKPRTC